MIVELRYHEQPVHLRFLASFLLLLAAHTQGIIAQPGSADRSFGSNGLATANYGTGFDAPIALHLLSDGSVLILGSRTTGRDWPNNHIYASHLNADGTVDRSYGTNGEALIPSSHRTGVLAQADGTILALSAVYDSSSAGRTELIRMNARGALDSTFGANGHLPLHDGVTANLPVHASIDGTIIMTDVSPGSLTLRRIRTDGMLDLSFGTNGLARFTFSDTTSIKDVAVLPNGTILALGVSPQSQSLIVLTIRPDGSPDASMGPGGIRFIPMHEHIGAVRIAGIDAAGRAIALIGIALSSSAIRFRSNGEIDSSYGSSGIIALPDVTTLATVGADGRLIYGGFSGPDKSMFFGRLDATGTPDSSFTHNTSSIFTTPTAGIINSSQGAIGLLPNGSSVMAVSLTSNTAHGITLLGFDEGGTPSPSWGVNGRVDLPSGPADDRLRQVLIGAGGRILTVGISFNSVGFDLSVAAFRNDGIPDSTFGTAGVAAVAAGSMFYNVSAQAAALQPDGGIVIAPAYARSFVQAGTELTVVRFTSDGRLDNRFGENGIVRIPIDRFADAQSIGIGKDGKIIISGRTLTPTHTEQGVVLRLHTDGRRDSTFGIDGIVRFTLATEPSSLPYLAIAPDGAIVISGKAKSTAPIVVGRLLQNGVLDPSFGENGWYTLTGSESRTTQNALTLDSTGSILLGTTFTPNTSSFALVSRITSRGIADSTFGSDGQVILNPSGLTKEVLRSLAVQEDGRVVVGGGRLVKRVATVSASETLPTLYRLKVSGEIDSTFGENGNAASSFPPTTASDVSVALDARGGIIAGFSLFVDEQLDMGVIRLDEGPMLSVSSPHAPHSDLHIRWNAGSDGITLVFDAESDEPVTLTFFDMLGKPVRSMDLSGTSATVSTEGLPHGAYLLRVRRGGSVSTIPIGL